MVCKWESFVKMIEMLYELKLGSFKSDYYGFSSAWELEKYIRHEYIKWPVEKALNNITVEVILNGE